MTGMKAIIKKEWLSYFYSPLAYVVLGLFALIMGIIFDVFIGIYQQANMPSPYGPSQQIPLGRLISQYFQNVAFILCFMTPMLTMRLFAEEKRQHTYELLFTAPLRGGELVLGKFFSAFGFVLAMLAFTIVYMGFLVFYGNPDIAVLATTYLGLALSMACYVALGALISACSSTQAVAAVINYVVLLFLWLVQNIGQRVTLSWGPIEWGPTLVYLSPLGHFNSFAEGVVHIKHVVYFVSFAIFTLFLTHKVVESNRWR